MKNFLYAGVALVALTVTASAADLTYEPAPAPVAVAPVFDWTGFYVGVHGGGAWGDFNVENVATAGGSTSAALGGAQVGYNYQVDKWVFGIQTDLAYTGISQDSTIIPGVNLNTKMNWLGSTTVRAGYAMDTWLFYAKGGVAYGEGEAKIDNFAYQNSNWHTGWTVGGGVEKAFTKNITGLLEYDYYDLGNADYNTPFGGVNAKFTNNVVKVGINYKF